MIAWRPYGECGLIALNLSESDRIQLVERFDRWLPDQCEEPVFGYDSCLLITRQRLTRPLLDQIVQEIDERQKGITLLTRDRGGRKIQEIVVSYDGCDLQSTATQLQLTTQELINLHTEPVYTVRFCGFAPGFVYLDGLDARLSIPRREQPRLSVAAGSIAIGGNHAGIYSTKSPGGWHLLGSTKEPLFSLESAEKKNPQEWLRSFSLKTGDCVRFVERI